MDKITNELKGMLPAITQAVNGQPGKLILASYGENPTTGKALRPMVEHYSTDSMPEMEPIIKAWTQQTHRNVYMPLALMNPELKAGKKGGLDDIQSIFGLCADFDDDQAFLWWERLPVNPSLVMETSKGRYQAIYLFEKPVKPEIVKNIAIDLKKYSACDHGTGDLSHVWRLPGTKNWPNKKKVDAGRSMQPQEVKNVLPFCGYTNIDTLKAKLALKPAKIASKQAEIAQKPAKIASLSDNDLLEKAFKSKNGAKIQQLYNGDWSGYPSQSEADQALCNHLAFWLDKDPGRMDAAFRTSGLMREKWDKKHFSNGKTYGQETVDKAIKGTTEVYQSRAPETTKQATKIVVMNKFSPRPWAIQLRKKYNLIYDPQKRLWIYDPQGGLWNENAETLLEAELRKNLLGDELLKKHYIAEILADVKSLAFTQEAKQEPPPHLIPFNNIIYNLKTDEQLKYGPEFFFSSKLAVDFNPDATCPFIDSIFLQIVRDPIHLYELAGYCLFRSYPYQKWFFLYGGGGNGKGLFLSILGALLGKNNIRSITPDQLISNNFATADLYGKFANLSGETSYSTLEKTSLLKQLVGGDLLRAERKYKEPFYFNNYAKLIFNTNSLPKTTDKTRAFYRRLYLIEFPNKFEGSDKEDKLLFQKITQEEFEGLAIKALGYLLNLYDSGFFFTRDRGVDELTEKYERLTNPLITFLDEETERDVNGALPKWQFRDLFVQWLKEKSFRVWNDTQIGKEMKLLGWDDGRHNFDGSTQRCWFGLKWKE